MPMSKLNTSEPVDEECRVKMYGWCCQVLDACKLRIETAETAMSYVDRYCSTLVGRATLRNRNEYQLASLTALYIAIKLYEPLQMEKSLFAALSRGQYTEMEIEAMEQSIVRTLKLRLNASAD